MYLLSGSGELMTDDCFASGYLGDAGHGNGM